MEDEATGSGAATAANSDSEKDVDTEERVRLFSSSLICSVLFLSGNTVIVVSCRTRS